VTEKSAHIEGLAAVLIDVAEAELSENGIEKLSLRAVAKRAGVSHGAPAHHFGDAKGLLTALATKGYDRLLGYQSRRMAAADTDSLSQIVASGLGYIDFATDHPELFQLMFNSAVPDRTNPAFSDISLAVFERLVDNTTAHNGVNPFACSDSMKGLMASWAVVHGLAELIISGRAERTLGLSKLSKVDRDDVLSSILLRVNQSRHDDRS
jgi:AcrR family transcriptional regulator